MNVEQITLGDLCEFKYGNSLPERKRIAGSIPVYGSNGVVGYHSQSVTHGETIIVGRKGSIGEVHYSDCSCFPIDTTYYISETKRDCHLKWLYYILRSLRLTELNKSSAVPGLNRNDAYEKKIIFPPLSIQKQIAAILEKADTVREKRRQANQLTGQFLQSAFLEMFGDPVTNTRGWERRSLDQLTSEIHPGSTPKEELHAFSDAGIIFLRSENVLDGSVSLTNQQRYIRSELYDNFPNLQVQSNDILLNIIGASIGRTALYDRTLGQALLNQNVCLIRCETENLCPVYLAHLFLTDRYQSFFRGTGRGGAQYALNARIVSELEIPCPPMSEQQKFADLAEKVELLRVKQRESEKELEDLFQSLMQRAFRGELDL